MGDETLLRELSETRVALRQARAELAADPFQRVVEFHAERDARTTEEMGCPLSLRVDGDVTCERAVRPRIELAKLNARVGALVKAAGPLLAARRRAVSGAVLIEMDPEAFHALREAVEQLRGDE